MEIGIIGLPLSGKTTIFNALTGSQAETSAFGSGRYGLHTAIVDVPDPRVGILSGMFNPRKTIYAKIQFSDISGVTSGQAQGGGLDPQLVSAASKTDALLLVVRAFESEQVPHPADSINPQRDLNALRLELILTDLIIVERRLERIQAGYMKAKTAERPMLDHERALMEQLKAALEQEVPIGDLALSEEDRTLLRGFQFLTAKPTMVVLNYGEDEEIPADLSWAVAGHQRTAVLPLRGALEMEIAQLPPDEMAEFLQSYGIAEPSLNLLVRQCYGLVGLMSFFTVGEDEVRAWTVQQGATAVEAAGVIHTDLARGFIRAEVLSYDDMIACQTMAEARRHGKLRLEGRDYTVQDGDILNIRFNV